MFFKFLYCCRRFLDRHDEDTAAQLLQHVRHDRRLSRAFRADHDHVAVRIVELHEGFERFLQLVPLHIHVELVRFRQRRVRGKDRLNLQMRARCLGGLDGLLLGLGSLFVLKVQAGKRSASSQARAYTAKKRV
eukprot:scaffold4938_cov142-Isochrysis_galbana.AAC.1